MNPDVILQSPSDNVAGAYATIGVNTGSEDADYPAAYLVDGRPGRPAKLTTTSGSWVLAYGGAQRVDMIVLGAHNLYAATLQGNATNDWTSPSFEVAVEIEPATADGHSANAWLPLSGWPGYSAAGFQYWRLLVWSNSPCAVGEVWLGRTVHVAARNYNWGYTITEKHPVIEHMTEFLIPHTYALGSRQRSIDVTFRATGAGALVLKEWYRSMKGTGLTGIFVPDGTVNDAWWVRQVNEYTETVIFTDVCDITMTLIEHASGVPL